MERKNRLALLTALAIAASTALPAAATVCDVPMIAQQVAVPPNVMIIADNSGSMNEAMWHEDYDPDVDYSGNFTSDKIYYVGSDGWREPRDFNYYWPSSPSAYLVEGLHGQDGRYIGNYLNWVYFHATEDQRLGIPTVTRQMVANEAIKRVINVASGLRYGIARFNYDSGAKIEAECGASVATLESEVDAMSANSWTPSAEALYSVMQYFKDSSGPIQYDCQKNFVIFVTDGLPTKDKNIPSWIGDQDGDNNEPGSCASIGAPQYSESNDCSDYLDDVAYYMANNDMRGDLDGEQNVITYTIGFGVDAPLLQTTAENGDGLYRLAWDLESLTAELGTVVGDIVNRISSGAAVAVVSTETGTDDRLYRGKFLPGDWRGYLEAFELPYDDGDRPVWEAGQILRDRSPYSRVLFTSTGGDMVEFSVSDLDVLGLYIAPDGPGSGGDMFDGYGVDLGELVLDDFDLAGPVGPNYDESYVHDVIEFVRGEEIAGFRDRNNWKLGDLVYSTPVVVGPPAAFYSDLEYHEFARNLESRSPIVYVGANDGMLHAFSADSGEELWAYLPEATLHKLELLADPNYCHSTFVDLSPRAFDVKLNGRWRTILLGGERTGGDSYFALDVTDPYSPELLWETRIPDIGSSYTDPVLVQTKAGPVLWTGSGPDNGGAAWAYVVSLETGDPMIYAHLSSIAGNNAATAPTPYDADFDGYADYVYQGDMAGNIYRFDVTSDGIGGWWYHHFYFGNEPISARPAVAIDFDGTANVMFGTGKFVEASDFTSFTTNRFVVVKDRMDYAAVDASALEDRTSNFDEAEIERGWYIWLENGSGERVTEPALSIENVVYFTSFAPSTRPCDSGGRSWLYRISLDGGSPIDHDDDGELSDEGRSEDLGTGVASRPVVNFAGEQLIVQTSDARLNVEELSVAPEKVMVRAWRERYEGQAQQTEEDPQTGGTN